MSLAIYDPIKLASRYAAGEDTPQIARSIGCSVSKVRRLILSTGMAMRLRGRKRGVIRNIVGEKFGRLRVLKMFRVKDVTRCLAVCDCGNRKSFAAYAIINGNTRTCGCGRTGRGWDSKAWRGHGEISASLWARIILGAEEREIPHSISIADGWSLFLRQDRRCALTGIELFFGKWSRTWKQQTSASLDRIDSQRGYVLGNVQWVHKSVNRMKMDMDQSEFICFCKAVSEHNP